MIRRSTAIQNQIKQACDLYFSQVMVEWNMAKNAKDAFSADEKRYAPRLDVAVGPFNIDPAYNKGAIEKTYNSSPYKFRSFISSNTLRRNDNPRCVLGIEVICSGSSKHILGDFTNASMMGLYGIIVVEPSMETKVQRIKQYIEVLKAVGKAPPSMFNNLVILSPNKLLMLLHPNVNVNTH